ncbi:MAG: asparagine synthase-related protein [Sedimentisphaerales bacterium]
MCGIASFNWKDNAAIEAMTGAMRHRSPDDRGTYLDYRLVPLALSLPDKYLPRQIVHRTKREFTVPVSSWIRSSYLIKEFLTGHRYYEGGPVNRERAQQLFDEHVSQRRDSARKLWLILVFSYWQSKQVSSA